MPRSHKNKGSYIKNKDLHFKKEKPIEPKTSLKQLIKKQRQFLKSRPVLIGLNLKDDNILRWKALASKENLTTNEEVAEYLLDR